MQEPADSSFDALEPGGAPSSPAAPAVTVAAPAAGAGAPPDFRKGRRTRASAPAVGSIDRLPPHSIPAEQGVLGCILLSPTDSTGLCVEKLKGGPESFYDLRHRTLYEHLVSMYDTKAPVDLITIQQRLKDAGQLDAVGGIAYVASLVDAVPSAANLEYYLGIVREKHLLRRVH